MIKLPFFRKKPEQDRVRFMMLYDYDDGVHQWSLNKSTFFSISILVIVLVSSFLFISADFLTDFLYQTRLEEIKKESHELTDFVGTLQNQVDKMKAELNELEDKDRALRTYASLPKIDKDIRRLGIGGSSSGRLTKLDKIMPDITKKISGLELDIDELIREVRLEKESYDNIYDAVKSNSEKMKSIPSIRPVEGGYLNTGFGMRKDPFTREERFHYGLDISAIRGSLVFAAADGKVVYAGYKGSFGRTIKINHGYGYQSLYAHLNRILIKSGTEVKRGDLIAEVGSTGRSTASHLHYEVHYYGKAQDPKNYFFAGYLK